MLSPANAAFRFSSVREPLRDIVTLHAVAGGAAATLRPSPVQPHIEGGADISMQIRINLTYETFGRVSWRIRTMTSTRLISAPSGGSGNRPTITNSPGM